MTIQKCDFLPEVFDVALAVAAVIVAVLIVMTAAAGYAETERQKVWVLCNPDSFVNIRSEPNKHSRQEGRIECGDWTMTDGRHRNGYLHVYHSVEAGEGWISEQYVVYEQPEEVNAPMVIDSRGRVACRKGVGGDRIRWAHNGDEVDVYWIADWAVTNKGFIKSEFLMEIPQGGV